MKRFLVILLVAAITALSACGTSTVNGSNGNTAPRSGIPTAIPQVWTAPVSYTDFQGYQYTVRESTVAFSPQPSSTSGIVQSAPPGQDWLDLEFQVTNLLTDRTAVFMDTAIQIFGPCGPGGNAGQTTAPNGQCLTSDLIFGYSNLPYGGHALGLAIGGTSNFDFYLLEPTGIDVTTWTMWLNTCTGDGDPFHCSLAGGVPLTPIPSSQSS
jgi:hypothetical protein